MKALHILSGILALLAGFVALYAAKGQWLHRRSGTVFAWSMMFLGGSGALIATFISFNRINIIAGTLSFYLVATGLLVVVRPVQEQRRWLSGLSALALVATASAWAFALIAAHSPDGKFDQFPAGPIYMFAVVGTLALVGDSRLLLSGRLGPQDRLHRHLWRMGYALWVASTSAFFGQARHLPQWLRDAHLTALPILAVTVTVLYWVLRVQWQKRWPRARARAAVATVTCSGTGP
jgi:uncharacterized membrane protein